MPIWLFTRSEPKSSLPALVFSLSGTVSHEAVTATLPVCSIWEISIDQPYNDHLYQKSILTQFHKVTRLTIDKIQQAHGMKAIHIFPAMPIAAAVQMGKLRMPKADMPWVIYDYNCKIHQFLKAITIQ